MGTVLEDIFGSDLGSDEEALLRDDTKPKPTSKQHRRDLDFGDSDEEPPRSERSPASKRRIHDTGFQSSDDDTPAPKREDRFSSDDEDGRQPALERERRKRKKKRKKKESKKKKVKSDDEYEDGYDAQPETETKPPKVEEEQPPPKPEKPKTAFEKALEENKALRRPRRKELDPAKIENESVVFLERMMKARDDDVLDKNNNKPALNKLKMLRDVELMCMKVSHREYLLDNMLLAIIKSWLDPGPDKSLPNVQIRHSLLDILLSMPVDSDWVERLETSQGLGRLIHYMSLREPHEPVKRMAEKLMRKWARPVYQSNSNYHDLLEEFDKPDEGRRAPKDGIASERRAARENVAKMKTAQERLQEFSSHKGKKREQILATVPRPAVFLYSTLAENEIPTDPKALRDRSARARNKKHDKTISRLRKRNKDMGARAARPSINGRDG